MYALCNNDVMCDDLCLEINLPLDAIKCLCVNFLNSCDVCVTLCNFVSFIFVTCYIGVSGSYININK
jgi:hypothetical protein